MELAVVQPFASNHGEHTFLMAKSSKPRAPTPSSKRSKPLTSTLFSRTRVATEMRLISALDDVDGAPRCISRRARDGLFRRRRRLCADAGKPACTILHLGVGLANALANLHNAKRACGPVLNLVGTMAAWHGAADAPLRRTCARAGSGAGACDVAVGADDCGPRRRAGSTRHPRLQGPASRVTTVLLPHDAQRAPADAASRHRPDGRRRRRLRGGASVYPDYVNHANACAAAFWSAAAPRYFRGSGLFDEEAFAALQQLEAATGCALVVAEQL